MVLGKLKGRLDRFRPRRERERSAAQRKRPNRNLLRRRSAGDGKILATKLGFNPNSSSLGVDVTFLLFGATAISFLTPVIAALIRKRTGDSQPQVAVGLADVDQSSEELDADA